MSDEAEQGPPRDEPPARERMELRHEPVPGYRTAFYIVVAVGVVYLAAVFFFFNGGAH